MKKKLLIDLTKTKNLFNGLGQFSYHLGKNIFEVAKRQENKFDLSVLVPEKQKNLFTDVESGNVRLKNSFFRDTTPDWLKRPFQSLWDFDLWHVTAQDSGFWPLDRKIPVVFTIHDLNFLRERDDPKVIAKKLLHLQKKVDRSALVTSISHFAASEIKAHLDLNGKSIKVIYNGGVEESSFCQNKISNNKKARNKRPESEKINRIDKPFLFTMGECLPKKNFSVLLPLIKQLPEYQLIVAGKDQTEYADRLRAEIIAQGLQDRVRLFGLVSEEEKIWLYSECEAFLFPSLTEGFGLPVIEAMHFGKPVFLSNLTSLPEIGGHMAFYWNTFETEEMLKVFRNGMETAVTDPDFSHNVILNANRFSWDTAAKAYLDVYRTLL